MFEKLIEDLSQDITLRDRYAQDPDRVISEYGLGEAERRLLRTANFNAIAAEYHRRITGRGRLPADIEMNGPATTTIIIVIESPRAHDSYWDGIVAHCEAMSEAA